MRKLPAERKLKRICLKRGCTTPLNSYNKNKFCLCHNILENIKTIDKLETVRLRLAKIRQQLIHKKVLNREHAISLRDRLIEKRDILTRAL